MDGRARCFLLHDLVRRILVNDFHSLTVMLHPNGTPITAEQQGALFQAYEKLTGQRIDDVRDQVFCDLNLGQDNGLFSAVLQLLQGSSMVVPADFTDTVLRTRVANYLSGNPQLTNSFKASDLIEGDIKGEEGKFNPSLAQYLGRLRRGGSAGIMEILALVNLLNVNIAVEYNDIDIQLFRPQSPLGSATTLRLRCENNQYTATGISDEGQPFHLSPEKWEFIFGPESTLALAALEPPPAEPIPSRHWAIRDVGEFVAVLERNRETLKHALLQRYPTLMDFWQAYDPDNSNAERIRDLFVYLNLTVPRICVDVASLCNAVIDTFKYEYSLIQLGKRKSKTNDSGIPPKKYMVTRPDDDFPQGVGEDMAVVDEDTPVPDVDEFMDEEEAGDDDDIEDMDMNVDRAQGGERAYLPPRQRREGQSHDDVAFGDLQALLRSLRDIRSKNGYPLRSVDAILVTRKNLAHIREWLDQVRSLGCTLPPFEQLQHEFFKARKWRILNVHGKRDDGMPAIVAYVVVTHSTHDLMLEYFCVGHAYPGRAVGNKVLQATIHGWLSAADDRNVFVKVADGDATAIQFLWNLGFRPWTNGTTTTPTPPGRESLAHMLAQNIHTLQSKDVEPYRPPDGTPLLFIHTASARYVEPEPRSPIS